MTPRHIGLFIMFKNLYHFTAMTCSDAEHIQNVNLLIGSPTEEPNQDHFNQLYPRIFSFFALKLIAY